MTKLKTSPKSNRSAIQPKTELVPLANLRPAERLVRSHPGHKKRTLEKSLRSQGLLDPITINSAGVIVDGHLRVEIALKLGWQTIAAVRIEHLTDEELRLHAIAANRLPTVANIDVTALRLELEEIEATAPTLDLTLTGFSIGEIDRVRGNYVSSLYDDLEDDRPIDGKMVPVARNGDSFELGEHRLICGDSLDSDVLSELVTGERARMIFTDPPYNVPIQGHVTSSDAHAEFAMASGEMNSEEFEAFLLQALRTGAAHLVDGGLAYVCMDHSHLEELLIAGAEVFDRRLNLCVWDKGQGGMGALYRSRHEMVAVFKKGGEPHINNVQLGKNGRDRSNVWSFPGMSGFGRGRKKARELHPTVKPVALIAEAILDVTAPGDIVLDQFGGSGSTLIAAERTGRQARLVELAPLYVERTIDRWEKLTGQTALHVGLDKPWSDLADERRAEFEQGVPRK